MGWLLLLSILILLILAVRMIPHEEENRMWGIFVFLYLLGIVNFDIGKFTFPLGILLGFLLLNRRPRVNRSLKNLALFFGLVYFILNFILPPVNIQDLWSYRERFIQINRFENVKTVSTFSSDSPKQVVLAAYAPNKSWNMNLDDCIVMFRTWVLIQENVPIKNFDWLWMESDDYLKFEDSYHRVDDYTAEGYLNFENKRRYFAFFKKKSKDGRYYLSMVVEYSQIRSGQERKFPF